MSTPQERVHEATRNLLDLLESGEATSVEAIGLRIELAEATAAAGQFEDALYQADELLKDAQREHGPDHPTADEARRLVAHVEGLARAAMDGGVTS